MKYKNLIELIDERANHSNSKIGFVDRQGYIKFISYSELLKSTKQVAQRLLSLSLNPGSIIGIMLPTCPEFLFSFFGVQMAGLIPVAIYPPLKIALIDDWQKNAIMQLKSVNAQSLLTDSQGKLVLGSSLEKGAIDVTQIGDTPLDLPETAIHKCAFLQFSSGTTGISKAVSISHSNVLFNSESILDGFHKSIWLTNTRPSCVSWLPLYHDMGLVGGLLTSVLADIDLFLIRPEDFIRDPYIWLKVISDVRGTVTVAPNFAYGLCSRRVTQEQIKKLDLSSLEVALCGAEMIHPKTMDEFYEKFKTCHLRSTALTPVYGLAEATLAVSFSKTDEPINWISFDKETLQPERKVNELKNGTAMASVGFPLKSMEIEIRDERSQKISDGIVGTIWISGLSVMEEYYNNAEMTKDVREGKWLNTGDYGFFWKGELFITGRKKEIIIIRGQNYDPTLIERSLAHFDELRDGCAVAFSSSRESTDSEELFILAELKKEIVPRAETLENLKGKIAIAISIDQNLSPKRIEFYKAGTLPRTSSGKIKRKLSKELWEKSELHLVSEKFNIFKIIIAIVRNKLKIS
jgi:fatty-acyl-CoA synthase